MKNNEYGFTLIELMVATAMVTIVVGVIYAAYNIQTKIYTEQDKTAEMQQNLRAGMWYLQREIRVAGYNPNIKDWSCNKPNIDPLNEDSSKPTSKAPAVHTIGYDATDSDAGKEQRMFGFSMDLNNDEDCEDSGENVTYSIYKIDGMWKLGRRILESDGDLSKSDPVAENISNIDFLYLLDSGGVKTQTRNPATSDYNNIVAVQISLLAQAKTEDRAAETTSTFTLPVPKWGENEDTEQIVWKEENSRYRYRLLTTTINLRNMGLL